MRCGGSSGDGTGKCVKAERPPETSRGPAEVGVRASVVEKGSRGGADWSGEDGAVLTCRKSMRWWGLEAWWAAAAAAAVRDWVDEADRAKGYAGPWSFGPALLGALFARSW
jgi:hypothetical protein